MLLKLTLRKKLLFFSVLLTLIPLGAASYFTTRITQDELKSFLNDELIVTAEQLSQDIDNLYTHTWLTPLMMMKRVAENSELGSSEKTTILAGIRDVLDIVSLQISIDGTASPTLLTQDNFTARLYEASLDPIDILKLRPEQIHKIQKENLNALSSQNAAISDAEYIPEIDTWLISVIIPLKDINGRQATLSARIDLERIRAKINRHSFTKNGNIILVDKKGRQILDGHSEDLSQYKIVEIVKGLLERGMPIRGVAPYIGPAGNRMLGAYTFPSNFNWGIIVEKDMSKAYIAVDKMLDSFAAMTLAALLIAVAGGVIFATRISKPILKIGQVVQQVGEGDLAIRVEEFKSRDEISDLGKRINKMIEGLRERFELQKFVSGYTMDAIRQADTGGIRLGGKRDTATVFFSDIRGFTAFSEGRAPETVIKMLNTYLRIQAEIVRKYGGDIDKYVGDELIAVFQEADMVKNAVLCAADIHQSINDLNKTHQWNIRVGIGINTGIMIMGAMGSEERMDYTILGDSVNLGSRLCSHAGPGETILSEYSYNYLKTEDIKFFRSRFLSVIKDEKIQVKGKSERIQIYKAMPG